MLFARLKVNDPFLGGASGDLGGLRLRLRSGLRPGLWPGLCRRRLEVRRSCCGSRGETLCWRELIRELICSLIFDAPSWGGQERPRASFRMSLWCIVTAKFGTLLEGSRQGASWRWREGLLAGP